MRLTIARGSVQDRKRGDLNSFKLLRQALNYPQSLQARVAALADDQMIMHGNF